MIQMTKEELSQYRKEKVSNLVKLIRPYLSHRLALYERYARKVNENQFMGDSKKHEGVVAFELYITTIVQGYLGGKAPMYSISSPSDYALAKKGMFSTEKIKKQYVEQYTQAVEYIRRYNDDAATFVELVHDYLITTAAYLYVYENEKNEVVYTRLDSRQTVAVYDYSTPPCHIGTVRIWKQKDESGNPVDAVEIITEEARRRYLDQKMVDEEFLFWHDVPCVAFENPDGIAVFEPALWEIDAYEQNLSNIRNMTKYNDNAKLILKGYTFETAPFLKDEEGNEIPNPARAEEERVLMEAVALAVAENGNIDWLIKNVDYSGVLATLKSYHDLITMLTGVPNMTDEAFANADNASALGYKLYALDQYSATFDRVAKKGLLRLWEIISNRLNLKGEAFDFRDIVIKLQRNIPTDKDKSLARAIAAYQAALISQETALNESQMELDAKDEMNRIAAENDADYQEMKKRGQEDSEDEQAEEDHSEQGVT